MPCWVAPSCYCAHRAAAQGVDVVQVVVDARNSSCARFAQHRHQIAHSLRSLSRSSSAPRSSTMILCMRPARDGGCVWDQGEEESNFP